MTTITKKTTLLARPLKHITIDAFSVDATERIVRVSGTNFTALKTFVTDPSGGFITLKIAKGTTEESLSFDGEASGEGIFAAALPESMGIVGGDTVKVTGEVNPAKIDFDQTPVTATCVAT